MLQAFNTALLILILKSEGVDSPSKFRPLSLCNVVHKIITKFITNRLKPILPTLVALEQSGFVEGRQILDGVILVHVVIHYLNVTKKPRMLLNWTSLNPMIN